MEGINLVIVILRKGFRESIQIYVVYHDSMTGGFFYECTARFYLDSISKCLKIGVLLTNEF